MYALLPELAIEKGAGSIYSVSVGFWVGSSYLRFPFRRRRRGRYVAYVALRFVVFRGACVACMMLVGDARACLRWVLFFVRLVPPGLPLLVLSLLLLVPAASLSLSASANGKPHNLTE